MALLKQYKTDHGVIRILRSSQDGRMAYFQNGCYHSQSTRHGVSLCAYVHVIHELVRQVYARNVLIIGCAGGNLATMLRRLHCKVTAVDINFMAFAIARRHFQLPETVRCVRRDGIAYLRTTKKKYDAVIVDVFSSDNTVPEIFTTEKFFHRVQHVLSSHGIMVMNVITRNDKDLQADKIARHAKAVSMPVTLFDWPGHTDRNTLIVGGDIRKAHIPSGHEPDWITADMQGIIRRKTLKRIFR